MHLFIFYVRAGWLALCDIADRRVAPYKFLAPSACFGALAGTVVFQLLH